MIEDSSAASRPATIVMVVCTVGLYVIFKPRDRT